MKFKEAMNAVGLFGKKTVFNLKKYSPEILTGGAIVLGIGTVVMTWVAARKTDKALEEPKRIIEQAKSMEIDQFYTKEDQKHDILLGYRKGAVAIIKLYGPVALMGASTVACILGSHRILSGRNAGLIAANSILSKEFEDYRGKVIEKYGKEEDHQLRFGDKMEQLTETITDENGEEKTVATEKPRKGYSNETTARIFDESCPAWKKDVLYNIGELKNLSGQLNDKLKADRILFLNDVYELLGYSKTQAGYQLGWVYDPRDEFKTYVDFGLPFEDHEWVHQMMAENQRCFWLDFNCKEIVWSKTPFQEV